MSGSFCFGQYQWPQRFHLLGHEERYIVVVVDAVLSLKPPTAVIADTGMWLYKEW